MIRTRRALLVEGKYDAARLHNLVDAMILTTDGFRIYKDRALQDMIRRVAAAQGLVILTDSDAAGFRIRHYAAKLAGAQHVVHAYVPAIPGKEARKETPGREGLLGVEGVPDELILAALRTALAADTACPDERPAGRAITYTDLYEWGISGTPDSAGKRRALLHRLGLPPRLSKKELVQVLNTLYTWESLNAQIAREDAAQ